MAAEPEGLAVSAPGALRFAYLLTGERELAEDLVQDAFIKVMGRFADLRRPDAFTAYLRKTIVNLSYGTFRHRRVERSYLSQQRRYAEPQSAGLDPERDDELWHRLAELPVRQRTALVLRYYEDLSEKQTAAAMGCSLRTVKALVNRGLTGLRAQEGGRS
jgi:RNA polymerase sigma-70 factor (sigma-E family)